MLKEKLKRTIQAMTLFEEMVGGKKGRFLCGDNLTVVDLLYYFSVCNMIYFKRTHADY